MFNFLFRKRPVDPSIKPFLLLIMDGFGVAPPSDGNAIHLARTPNYDRFWQEYPCGELIASGESVGLPANEVGNTEVGHLTIGAGRVLYQDLPRISKAVEEGNFYENEVLKKAAAHVKQNNSSMHLIGLVGRGKVHSSMDHFWGVVELCRREGLKQVYLHLFTDGRDSHPKSGADVLAEVQSKLDTLGVGRIASVAGRYYSMDRDKRWERTEAAYNAIVLGQGPSADSAEKVVRDFYQKQITDEFIKPTVIMQDGKPVGTVEDNDAAIFFNFRVDRPKQLTMAMVMKDFEQLGQKGFAMEKDAGEGKPPAQEPISQTFTRQKIVQNLFFVTMTQYQKDLPVSGVAYPPQRVSDGLPAIVAAHGMRHMHMAESEKERFVSYYINGLTEEPYENEEKLTIPSPKVATYDKKPEMSLPELTKTFIQKVHECNYHFFVMNFANADMVGHTGVIPAAVKAVEKIDWALGEIEKVLEQYDGAALITADHGNAEEMLTYPRDNFFFTTGEGKSNTEHSNNKVPVLIIGKRFKGQAVKLPAGSLADVAPTVLHIMGLPRSEGMTGRSLLGG